MMGYGGPTATTTGSPVVSHRHPAPSSRIAATPNVQSDLRSSVGRGSPVTPKLSAAKPRAIDQAAKNELESLLRKPALSSEEK